MQGHSMLTSIMFTFSSAKELTEEEYEKHMLAFKGYVKRTIGHDKIVYNYEQANRLHIHGLIFNVGKLEVEDLCKKYSKYMHKRIGRKGLNSSIAAKVEECIQQEDVYSYILKSHY